MVTGEEFTANAMRNLAALQEKLEAMEAAA